jgi:hypothetical protein
MKSIKYFLLLLLFIRSITIYSQTACDSMEVCDCIWRDLSPAGTMTGHEHAKGSWKISYRYMSMMMKDNISGTTKVDDNYVFNNYIMAPQTMQMDMHMLMAMYGFTDRFSVMAMFNYNVNTMSMTAFPGSTMIMDGKPTVMSNYTNMITKTAGLGDTKLYAVYAIVNRNAHHLFLSAGINLPTGSISVKGKSDDMMYPDSRYPYMMQLGSGTVDFMPGITYLLKKEKFSASAQVSSVLRHFNNSNNYHLGNELNASIWTAYKWLPWISTSVRAEENVTGKMVGKDISLVENNEPAAFSSNYGGQTTTAFAGLNFYFNRTWFQHSKLTFEYGMPIYQNTNGIQLAQKSMLYAGCVVSF